jgi:hypothetical protein
MFAYRFHLAQYVKGDMIARIFSSSDEAADDHPIRTSAPLRADA